MAEFIIIAKVTNRLAYDPNQEEVFRAFVFRSLNEDLYKYEKIDFDKSGDIGSATIVFQQGVIQNDEGFLVCVAAFDWNPNPVDKVFVIVCYPVATGRIGRRWKCKNTVSGKEWLAGPSFKFEGRLARDAYHDTDLIKKPEGGIILHKGWGGKKNPNLWQVTSMKQKPGMFKVVDENGVNIVTDFSTRLNAQKYIDYYRFVEGSTTTPPEPPVTPPSPTPVIPPPPSPPVTPPSPPPTPPPSGEGKFKAANEVLQIYANDSRIPLWVLGQWQLD